MTPKRALWTDEQIAFVRSRYANTPTKELADLLGRTTTSVYQLAGRLGLKKSTNYLSSPASGRLDGARGAATRFAEGHAPWNKGKPGSAGNHPNSKRTQFKKGNMSGAAQHNYVPIGSTRISKDGYLEVKITDDHPVPARRWVGAHRLEWEKVHGPVPLRHVVTFKPGMRTVDPDEIRVDRLECISQADNMRRNTLHRYPKEIAQAIQLRGALNRRINREQKHQSSS